MAINWADHPTHYHVRAFLRSYADEVAHVVLGTWNTYTDHPPGYYLDDISIDWWGQHGRGDPLTELQGDTVAKYLIQNRHKRPIAWLIWNSKIWTPGQKWEPYSGWAGTHQDHVHCTFDAYSRTGDRWPI